MNSLDAILQANDVVAVLGRDVRVRLVDVSNSGCLIHSEARLAEGTTGTLRVMFDGVGVRRRCAHHAMPAVERSRPVVRARG